MILCGSSFKNKGVQQCRTVVDYLPSPVEVPDIKGVKYKEDEAITKKF